MSENSQESGIYEQSETDESENSSEQNDTVVDLVPHHDTAERENSKLRSQRRCSSKIFSLSKNSRMAAIYKYDEIIPWDFESIFEFETAE